MSADKEATAATALEARSELGLQLRQAAREKPAQKQLK